MRKVISLALALTLSAGGIGMCIFLFFFAHGMSKYVSAISVFAGLIGLLWLWEDIKDWRSPS
jgi:hypothetical protein